MKQKIVYGVIGLVVLGLFVTGIVESETVLGKARYVYYYAVGKLTSRPAPKNPEHARVCRENLHRMQAGKRKAAQDRGNQIGAITWEEMLRAMYPNTNVRGMNQAQINTLIPKCPSGGIYSIGTLEEVPRCSIAGNDTTTLQDDHIILD